ncbi:MAG TPA: hypothetical protein VK742_19150 [Candidatus Sulfotelmatobacter sp.]|jgi:hypothetical protein|nr:hypothetical protein [Candidatus Sulfotelmatobacter sp.]
MDYAKCDALKLAFNRQPEPWLAPIEQFFDGNDDAGSIGWDTDPYPGIEVYRDLLTGLSRRPDVQAVYAQLSELDLNERDVWASADMVYVVGTISADEVRNILSPLQPVEVVSIEFAVPEFIKQKHHAPVVAVRL